MLNRQAARSRSSRVLLLLSTLVALAACPEQDKNRRPATKPAPSTRIEIAAPNEAAPEVAGSTSERVKTAGRLARNELDYLRRILRVSDQKQPSTTAARPCRADESEKRVPGTNLLVVENAPWLAAVIDAGLCVYGCALCSGRDSVSALTLADHCPRATDAIAEADRKLRDAGL